MTEPTSLYRCFDAEGGLLYVGITKQGLRRFGQHSALSAWWSEVARVEVDHFATRQAALDAEGAAIWSLQPPFNTQRSGIPPGTDSAELLHLVQCRARHQAATAELHQAAAAVVAAGCPLRTAAAAAGVSSPQTIANWAAQATTEEP